MANFFLKSYFTHLLFEDWLFVHKQNIDGNDGNLNIFFVMAVTQTNVSASSLDAPSNRDHYFSSSGSRTLIRLV